MAIINRTTLLANIKNNTKWSFNPMFDRTMAQPLDSSSIAETVSALSTYASTNTVAYPGQIVTVVDTNLVRPYYINIDGTVKEVGAEISGNSTIGGTLNVSGATTLNSKLNVKGNVTLGDGTADTVTISGPTTIGGTFKASGVSTLESDLNVNGNTVLGNALTDTTTIQGTLEVSGATTLNSTLNINGNTVLGDSSSDTVTIKGSETVNVDLIVNRDTSLVNTNISGNLSVSGITNLNTLNSGNISSTGSVTAKTSVIGTGLTVKSQTLLVGTYNETLTENLKNGEDSAIFTVGKGSSASDRENAFSVSSKGIHVNGEIYVNGSVINTDARQSDWNVTDTTDPAYIKNKPTLIFYQSDWNETDSSKSAYIQNKIPVEASTEALQIGRGIITLSDGVDSVSFSISDLRKLLSLLNNNPALITGLSTTVDGDVITFSEGTDTTNSSNYN